MKNISELAIELNVSKEDIIDFLVKSSPSTFSFQRLWVNPYIDRAWESKVRACFVSGKNKTDFLNNIIFNKLNGIKKFAGMADAKKQQEQQKQKGKMMKISDLAKELCVSSDKIIFFLKKSSPFTFSGVNLNEKSSIDNFWESKVRNHFSGESDKSGADLQQKSSGERVFIGDLAAELGVEPEIIRSCLMKMYPHKFRCIEDTYSIEEAYASIIRANPAFNHSHKSAETKTSKHTSVSTSIFDAASAKEDKKVESRYVSTSILDAVVKQQQATQQKPQCEKDNIREIWEFKKTRSDIQWSTEDDNNKGKPEMRNRKKDPKDLNVKNVVVDLQEAVSKCMTGDVNNFWERISSILKDAKQHLDGEKVKIAFAGQMKAGKSTLVNMILGEELSATGIIRATATVIEFHYSLDERVEFIKNDRVCGQPIAIDEAGKEKAQKEMRNASSEYDFIRIFCNKPILNTFVLVDVPGAGDLEGNIREKIRNYLTKNEVSTIVWVSDISTSLPKDECDYIKELMALDKNMIFVLNCKEEKTKEDKQKFEENFKKNIPGYEPHIFSVKTAEKPQIASGAPERIRERLERKYRQDKADQELFTNELSEKSKEIRAKNGEAVIKMLPNEFEKVLQDERESAVKARSGLRRKFFDEFAARILLIANKVKYLESDFDSWWNRKLMNLDTKIKNNSRSFAGNPDFPGNPDEERKIVSEWEVSLLGEIDEKIDAVFNIFAKELGIYSEFVDIDFIHTAILLKEGRMQYLKNQLNFCLYLLKSTMSRSNYESKKEATDSNVKNVLSEISSSVKFFFTLIFDDCLTNFVACHNDIWINYLKKKDQLKNCVDKSEFDFNVDEKSLLKSKEYFRTTDEYNAWANETLSIYAGELNSDGLLTTSEERLFKKFQSALFGRKNWEEYFKNSASEPELHPIAFRLKAETTEGKELRDFMKKDHSCNDEIFERKVIILEGIKSGELKDFDKLTYEFARLCMVSKLKNPDRIEWDFMPENYKI